MQLTDYSHLRKDGTITIPLNGETYEAAADPPAGVSLESYGGITPEDLTAVAALIDNSNGEIDIDPEKDPKGTAAAMRAGAAGMSQTSRTIRFFEQVLTEESLERWVAAFMPADPNWSATEKKKHAKRRITLPQMTAVYKDLLRVYAGRPTTPPSSSQNGHGGTGGASTAGAQAGA